MKATEDRLYRAIAALKEIEKLGHTSHHARGYSLANIAKKALEEVDD